VEVSLRKKQSLVIVKAAVEIEVIVQQTKLFMFSFISSLYVLRRRRKQKWQLVTLFVPFIRWQG
jgi:hypothetical protein